MTPGELRERALHPLVYAAADRHGVPRALLLGLVEAESRRRAWAERWGPFTVRATAALQRSDHATLQAILHTLAEELGSDDLSFGCAQQTWRWSEEYAAQYGTDPRGRTDLAAVLAFRARYFDPAHALDVAARRLKALLARPDVAGDPLLALFRYNKPAPGSEPSPGAQRNYVESYQRALGWVEADMAGIPFQGGFLDKAEALRAQGIDPGEPVEPELGLGRYHVVQTTTTGVMWYSKHGNVVHFFPGA